MVDMCILVARIESDFIMQCWEWGENFFVCTTWGGSKSLAKAEA